MFSYRDPRSYLIWGDKHTVISALSSRVDFLGASIKSMSGIQVEGFKTLLAHAGIWLYQGEGGSKNGKILSNVL